jgi:UDP-N-acetylmuramate dehydrogenase
MHESLQALRERGFRGSIESQVSLAPFTTWRIGGPAELLATPLDTEDVALAVRFAKESQMPLHVLGNGSNLLISDAGVTGLVLRMRKTMQQLELRDETIRVGAGASFPAVARAAAQAGLSGLEFAGGIPGTIGGALVMNAGWHQFEIGAAVRFVDYVDQQGAPQRIQASDDESSPERKLFRYRGSWFHDEQLTLCSCELQLRSEESKVIRERMLEFAQSRKANQPTQQRSCGSVFIQPAGDFAGRLIEQAGLKGTRRGDIEVSPKHANFFVSHGDRGSSADVLHLVEQVQSAVFKQFGVTLETEFEYWD